MLPLNTGILSFADVFCSCAGFLMLSCHLKWSGELICIRANTAKIPFLNGVFKIAFSFKMDWFADTVYSKAACAGRKGRVRWNQK